MISLFGEYKVKLFIFIVCCPMMYMSVFWWKNVSMYLSPVTGSKAIPR
jgi:hypothetical protein